MSSSSGTISLDSIASRRADDLVLRSRKNERVAGKGRRRRAASEQRQSEQQNWNRLVMHDAEDEFLEASRAPPLGRRQSRRMARRLARQEQEDQLALDMNGDDDDDLNVAFAISLSLEEHGSSPTWHNHAYSSRIQQLDMSYESLILLQNVTCPAPPGTIDRLTRYIFSKIENSALLENTDELCTICQHECSDGDLMITLPCMHNFHNECGSEWLLHHSKLCPICKVDVTEVE